MMGKVRICAHATGGYSSHQIACNLETDVAFRMLAAGDFPKHRAVCGVRHRHLTAFKAPFVGGGCVGARGGVHVIPPG